VQLTNIASADPTPEQEEKIIVYLGSQNKGRYDGKTLYESLKAKGVKVALPLESVNQGTVLDPGKAPWLRTLLLKTPSRPDYGAYNIGDAKLWQPYGASTDGVEGAAFDVKVTLPDVKVNLDAAAKEVAAKRRAVEGKVQEVAATWQGIDTKIKNMGAAAAAKAKSVLARQRSAWSDFWQKWTKGAAADVEVDDMNLLVAQVNDARGGDKLENLPLTATSDRAKLKLDKLKAKVDVSIDDGAADEAKRVKARVIETRDDAYKGDLFVGEQEVEALEGFFDAVNPFAPSAEAEAKVKEVAAQWPELEAKMKADPKIDRALKPQHDAWVDFWTKWQKGEKNQEAIRAMIADVNVARANALGIFTQDDKKRVADIASEKLSTARGAAQATDDAAKEAERKAKEATKGWWEENKGKVAAGLAATLATLVAAAKVLR